MASEVVQQTTSTSTDDNEEDTYFSCQDFDSDDEAPDFLTSSTGSVSRALSTSSFSREPFRAPSLVTLSPERRLTVSGNNSVNNNILSQINPENYEEEGDEGSSMDPVSYNIITRENSAKGLATTLKTDELNRDSQRVNKIEKETDDRDDGDVENPKSSSALQERFKIKSLISKIKTKGEEVHRSMTQMMDKVPFPSLNTTLTTTPTSSPSLESIDTKTEDDLFSRDRATSRVMEIGKFFNDKITRLSLSIMPVSTGGHLLNTQVRRKSRREFHQVAPVQCIKAHEHAIWVMKFSTDGRYLASAGGDSIVRVWKVCYDKTKKPKLSEETVKDKENSYNASGGSSSSEKEKEIESEGFDFFDKVLFRAFSGHMGDVLDLSWAPLSPRSTSVQNHFLLSASMDSTVRLWLVDGSSTNGMGGGCLHVFNHPDIVTGISCHPIDDGVFLSGGLDGKVRLWSVIEKRVKREVDAGEFVTSTSFTVDGKIAVVGSYGGKCTLFDGETLSSITQIHVHSSRGKNRKGKKITGIEALPNGEHIMITSNDSRIRVYSLIDYSLVCKYKGLINNSFQIRASLSTNGRYIICGSEDHNIYIWNTNQEFTAHDNLLLLGNTRKDVCNSYEHFSGHQKVVTVSIFAPISSLNLSLSPNNNNNNNHQSHGKIHRKSFSMSTVADNFLNLDDPNQLYERQFIISADSGGYIKVFENQTVVPILTSSLPLTPPGSNITNNNNNNNNNNNSNTSLPPSPPNLSQQQSSNLSTSF